jgi:hypothetical protein
MRLRFATPHNRRRGSFIPKEGALALDWELEFEGCQDSAI